MPSLLNTIIPIKGRDYRIAEEEVSGRNVTLTLIEADTIVHACPPEGSGLTPCCGRTPFELPYSDRMTLTGLVTCVGAIQGDNK